MKKKQLIIMLIAAIAQTLIAQKIEMPDSILKVKLDSVLAEAHILYKYEKAAWIATDLSLEKSEIITNFGSYFIYQENELIKAIIIDKKNQFCIAEYIFENDFSKPKQIITEKRTLSNIELNLIKVRNRITENLSDRKYEISIPNGYNPNLIMLPWGEKFKMYMIMGTTQRDVIPFGNDYLFVCNKDGEIETWTKFHSRLIPGYTKIAGAKVNELTHSHLHTTALITATDICTFMLYAPLYDIKSFSVYSPAISKYMKYTIANNEISFY